MVMKLFLLIICCSVLVSLLAPLVFAHTVCAEEKVILLEDFNDLENWRPLYFPKIKEHTEYSVQKKTDGNYLKAESNASASAIVYKKEFNVYDYPKVRWRWKISNIYRKGNALIKSGDDYPLRVYIIFKYNPEKASFGQKVKYGLARKLYGEYPPHSTLNYIWANRKHSKRLLTNTYAKEAKMIILQTGNEKAGTWQEQEVHILHDYREVFGIDPPATASVAIMNDSDNTGEHSFSYVDYIGVYK